MYNIFFEKIIAPEELEQEALIRSLGIPVVTFWQSSMIDPSELPFEPQNMPDIFTEFRKQIELKYELEFDYTITNDVMKVVKNFGCNLLKQDLHLFCIYDIGIPKVNELDAVRSFQKIYGCSIKRKSDLGNS